jgi:hypothetical protein
MKCVNTLLLFKVFEPFAQLFFLTLIFGLAKKTGINVQEIKLVEKVHSKWLLLRSADRDLN